MSGNRVSRRGFLKTGAGAAAAALGFPYVVPSTVLGAGEAVAPSDKIVMGCVGIGWMGGENLRSFLSLSDAKVVAVCDVDKVHLAKAKKFVDGRYGNGNCATYEDFRELLGREDIDAVMLALPDHWHSVPAIMAAKAGKDIYGEKPLSHSFAEGRAMCEAVKKYGRVWQTGSWQRSRPHFRQACELVRNGYIGQVSRVEIGLPGGHSDYEGTNGEEAPVEAPERLNYERWLGPAPYRPYCPALLHKNWRWVMDFGGGQLMDWVGHHVDIAHWGLGFDRTGPLEVEGWGEFPATGLWDSATRYKVELKYAGGLAMTIADGSVYPGGTKWIGDKGWVHVNRRGMTTEPAGLKNVKLGAGEVHLYKSPGHHQDFLDCVRSRRETITSCETAHRSATPGHLGQISMLLGRKIRFDPETEEIIGDAEASKMLGNVLRSPWKI